jgi:hypothetical protein
MAARLRAGKQEESEALAKVAERDLDFPPLKLKREKA